MRYLMNIKRVKFFMTVLYVMGLILLFTASIFAQTPSDTLQPKSPVVKKSDPSCPLARTKVITFYRNHLIPAGIGISSGRYTSVRGYRYINIFVEFEQTSADEKPVSLGVVFAPERSGECGARRYFNFEQNFSSPAHPQMITLSGEGSWHGSPHNKSSYIARFPVMGPYIQVFPFNHENKDRKITIKAYLST